MKGAVSEGQVEETYHINHTDKSTSLKLNKIRKQ